MALILFVDALFLLAAQILSSSHPLSLYAHCCCELLLLIFQTAPYPPVLVLAILRYYLLLLKNVYPPQLAGKLDCNLLGRQIFLLLEYCIVGWYSPTAKPELCWSGHYVG